MSVAGSVFAGDVCGGGSTPISNVGYNLDSGHSCVTSTANGSVIDTPAGLAAGLADNGGPTQTIALLPGSAAIGLIPHGTLGLCPRTDQRGVNSVPGQACDAGAVQSVVPGVPRSLVATRGNGSVSVSFDVPSSDGGTAITGYAVSCVSSDGGAAGSDVGVASPIVVSGLTNGKSYSCTAIASNAVGGGLPSDASNTVVPANAVVNCADAGPGSLRAAVAVAGSGDTIVFDSPLGCDEIVLTSGSINITTDVMVLGPGASALAVNGGSTSRVFTTQAGTDVTISGLTIRGGNGNGGGGGGAVFNQGTLMLSGVIVSDNSASDGGAVYNLGALTVSASTVANNTASNAGGGIFSASGSVSVSASTVANNTASSGGGLTAVGGIAVVSGSTFVGNANGSLENSGGSVSVSGSIFADGGCQDPLEDIADGGFNLDSGSSCVTSTANGSVINTPAGLDPAGLADNGGPTQTIKLLAGSAAIGMIPNPTAGLCPRVDQRGVASVAGQACDAGAFQTACGSACVVVGDKSILETNGLTKTMLVPVTLSAPSNQQVTVHYTVTNGTATGGSSAMAGTDYKLKSGTLVFKPSTATNLTPISKTIAVTVYGDTNAAEGDETVTVTLDTPIGNGYSIGPGTGTGACGATPGCATGTILDDDNGPAGFTLGVGDGSASSRLGVGSRPRRFR